MILNDIVIKTDTIVTVVIIVVLLFLGVLLPMIISEPKYRSSINKIIINFFKIITYPFFVLIEITTNPIKEKTHKFWNKTHKFWNKINKGWKRIHITLSIVIPIIFFLLDLYGLDVLWFLIFPLYYLFVILVEWIKDGFKERD